MMTHELRAEDSILVLRPEGALAASDSRLMPRVASHFVHARLQHFDDEVSAMLWLNAAPGQGSPNLDKEQVS